MSEREKSSLPMQLKRQFTATVFILENEKVLLIHHKKFQKWLPPGGHLEPNELPTEAAIREAKEETGLDISLISEENLWISPKKNAKSIERPFMCLLENIPEMKGEPAHQHIDLIYIGIPVGGTLALNEMETKDLKWFSWEELKQLMKSDKIFEETYETIAQLLAKSPVL